jgi:DNA invertase Pin-like site-specific DNA recombinase
MKIALYCRVSTDEQNTIHQEKALVKYCDIHNHEVYKVYRDVYTGKAESRPAFNEMLQDMRRYKFNAIAVVKLDRLGRSLKHLLSLIEEFKNKGVHFIAIDQNIDTNSSMGTLQLQMIGAFAEFERNLISERTKAAIKDNPLVGKRGKDRKPRKLRGNLRSKLELGVEE